MESYLWQSSVLLPVFDPVLWKPRCLFLIANSGLYVHTPCYLNHIGYSFTGVLLSIKRLEFVRIKLQVFCTVKKGWKYQMPPSSRELRK